MRIGAVLSPVANWKDVEGAARLADELGLDSIGFWDHYHSPRPEWGYVCGWSAYGYLAAITSGIRLVPNVLNCLHYDVGVLAKESSVLALASHGRFELGIGAGDWPDSFEAWGQSFPPPAARLARVEETVLALRDLWRGGAVRFAGEHVQLRDAICTPAPPAPPRVVVGVGASVSTLRHAIRYADEVNLYAGRDLLGLAHRLIEESGRSVDVSIVLGWEMDKWPVDVASELAEWADANVTRVLVNVGGSDMVERVRQLAGHAQIAGDRGASPDRTDGTV